MAALKEWLQTGPTLADGEWIYPNGMTPAQLAADPTMLDTFAVVTSPTIVGGLDVRQPNATSQAIGFNSGAAITTAVQSTAYGYSAQASLVTGGYNTAIGYSAQLNLVGNGITSGCYNTAVGADTQRGVGNFTACTAVGYNAQNLATGNFNSALGAGAQAAAMTGAQNTAIGYNAQNLVTSGSSNTGVGYVTQSAITTGAFNVSVGTSTLTAVTTTQYNTAVGHAAMINATGSKSTSIGGDTMRGSAAYTNTTAVGYEAQRNATGDQNTSVGASSLRETTGTNNVAVGYGAGYATTNSAVTANATTSASRGTYLGVRSGAGSSTQNNDMTCVGYGAVGNATGAIAIGSGASAGHASAVALGFGIATTAANQVELGAAHLEIAEVTTPATPASGSVRIYADNSSGTRLMAKFASGTAVQIATASGSPLTVDMGGTGRATATTAYGLIAAGTTATGVQQTLATGNAGDILKSGGAGALPAFAAGAKSDVGLGNVDNTSDATKNTAAVTLSNKTIDNTNAITVKTSGLTIQDSTDTTKQVTLVASGIATGTTRVLTLPNASGTILQSGTAVTVAQGGTGRATSTTAYGLIAAGTTTTGAHQTISPGTSGQILKSNGAAALATFQTGVPADVGLGNVDNTSDATKNAAAVTLTNKTLDNTNAVTLKGSSFTLQDATDVTKQALFVMSGITTATTRQLTVPNATGTIVLNNNTATLSNKRITARVTSTASSATPAPSADNDDQYVLTALAAGATFAAPSGTPTDGQKLIVRIKDDGTARSLSWNAIYRSVGTPFPVTTFAGKLLYCNFIYNSADTKWDLVAVAQEV